MGQQLLHERYQWLDSQVRAGKYPNATTLSNKFEISQRQAQRNITFMRDRLMMPLEYDEVHRGYKYEDHSVTLPALRASQEEVVSILIARDMISNSAEGIISKTIHSFGKKLFSTMGGIGFTADKIQNAFSAVWTGYSPAQADVFKIIVDALLNERVFYCEYKSPGSDSITQREIEPHHLQHYMGSWVLIGWCRLRNDWRKFYLSRMINPAVTEKTFDPREREDWNHLLETGFGIFQGKDAVTVKLRFNNFRAGWIREQVWHSEQVIEELPDGCLDLSFPVSDFREVKMKILQFGADVKVVEPHELMEEVKREIKKMQKVY